MRTVLSIVRKEIRVTVWAPLGMLACLALITLILHLQGYWSDRILVWYSFALGLLALYMGAEAVSGDQASRWLEWQSQWPISRAKWWLLKLLLQGAGTFVCAALAYGMLMWLAGHHATGQTREHFTLGSAWLVGLSIIPVFITAFFASSVCRTSMQAFFLALGLSWLLAVIESLPMMARVMAGGMAGRMPDFPTPTLYIVPWAAACVALLAGSFHGFTSTAPLAYGKRAGRAFGVLLALVIPVTIVTGAYAVYGGVRGGHRGGPFAFGGGSSSAPGGISAATISPDGQRLAFTDGVFSQTLWVMNADGSNLRQVVPQRVDQFLWLRDSRRLVVATQAREPIRVSSHTQTMQTGQQHQWSVVDVEDRHSKLAPILQTSTSGSQMSRLSPQGKYLWLDGRFIEVETWKSAGQVEVPNYGPWFLTWLPDDSAIYVYEHQVPRFPGRGASGPVANPPSTAGTRPPGIKRIAVPSGEITAATLPKEAVINGRLDPYQVHPLTEQSGWCSADHSTYVELPPDKQPVIYRSTSVRGPNNVQGRRTYADPITRRCVARTVLYQLGGTRQIALNGFAPCRGGLSPSGRYCLVNVADGVAQYDDRAPWYAAILDMTTGQIIQRMTLPGLTSMDSSEDGLRWSPDEQWVADVVSQWDEKTRPKELLLASRSGAFKRLPLGEVEGWGSSGVVGWTAANQFVVIRQERQLVGIGVNGQEQVLMQSEQPWPERMARLSDRQTSAKPTGTSSGPSPTPTPTPVPPPPASAAPPTQPEPVASDDTTPESFMASVLGVQPAQVTDVTPVLPEGFSRPAQRGLEWEGRVNGQAIHVTSSGPGQWTMRVLKPSTPPAAGGATMEQARTTAGALLHRRFGGASARMTESNAAQLGNTGFMFSWTGLQVDGRPGASAQLTLDAAGKVKSYSEQRAQAQAAAAAPSPLPHEIEETPAHFAAAILGVPESEIPSPAASGASWWVYQIRGRTYHVEHSPFRWGLLLWSEYQPGKTIEAAQARGIARKLVSPRLSPHAAPGGTMKWKDGKIFHYSFDCKETLGPDIQTGDSASVVLFADGTLMTYEERRLLPKLSLRDVKVTRAKARQIADGLVRWGQGAERTHYTFKRMWLEMRAEPSNDASFGPVWSVQYTPAGTIEDWRRIHPKFGYIRIDAMTGKIMSP